jgi:hypothetical protein
VVDLYELKLAERRRFVRLFLESLIHLPRDLWRPTLVILDEAHIYRPERGSGEAESTEAVISLMSQRRKRGYAGVIATQRLSKLHKDAAAEANNVIGRTRLDADQVRAGDALGLSKADRLKLRDVGQGEFYAFGPALGQPGVVHFRSEQVRTTHPRPGERYLLTAPAPSRAIRGVLNKFADLPQEAEEEIRGLDQARRRIAELERHLKGASGEQQIDQATIDRAVTSAVERERIEWQRKLEQRLSPMSSGTGRSQDNDRAAARTGGGKRGGEVEGEFRIPRGLMSEDGIEHDEQLAHAGGERDLGFLTGCPQPCVKRLQHRVAARRYQGTHVEHRADLGAAAPNRAPAAQLAAVMIERCDAYQRCDLAAAESPEFRQMGQKGSHRDAAHRRYGAEQPCLFRPQRRSPNRLLQGNIELGQLFAQPTDVRGNGTVNTLGCAPVPIALGGEHFDNLPAPCGQCHQFPALRVWQWPGLRLDKFGEMRQYPGVDRIGLRQPAGGASKVAYLARIDHCYRQTRRGQFTGGRDFVATAGFKHDAAHAQFLQMLDQSRNAALIVGHAEAFIARPQRRIEPRFRHIDSDEQVIFHRFLQTPSPSLRDTGLLTLATVRALRFLSGRDDQALPTVFENLGEGRSCHTRTHSNRWKAEDTRAGLAIAQDRI